MKKWKKPVLKIVKKDILKKIKPKSSCLDSQNKTDVAFVNNKNDIRK